MIKEQKNTPENTAEESADYHGPVKIDREAFFSEKDGRKIFDAEKFLDRLGLNEVVSEKVENDPNLKKALEIDQISLEGISPELKAELIWYHFGELVSQARWLLVEERNTKGASAVKEDEEKRRKDKFIENLNRDQILAITNLREFWNDSEVREIFEKEYSRHLEEAEEINGQHDQAKVSQREIKKLENMANIFLAEIFSSPNGFDSYSASVRLYRGVRKKAEKASAELGHLLEENPEVAALVEYEKLREYQRQFKKDGFMWLPSRQEYLRKLAEMLLAKRPVQILSESGAGKTVLVEALAQILSGESVAKIVGSPNMRAEKFFAERDFEDGSAFYRYGPALEALSGKATSKDDQPKHDGKILLVDEANKIPSDELFTFVKTLSKGYRPGEIISDPAGYVKEKVLPNAGVIMTGNPDSPKYERNEIDIAAEREFGANRLHLDYFEQTPENPEVFKFLLVALLETRGRLRLPVGEIAPAFKEDRSEGKMVIDDDPKAGGFLWRFSNCWRQMLDAFSWRENELSKANPGQDKSRFYFQKFFFDPGIVLGWLQKYKRSGEGSSLESFVKKELIRFIENSDVLESDKDLAKDFFDHYGIDLEEDDDRNKKRPFVIMTPKDVGFLMPDVPRPAQGESVVSPDVIIYTAEDGSEVEYVPSANDPNVKVGDVRVKDGFKFRVLGTITSGENRGGLFMECIGSTASNES